MFNKIINAVIVIFLCVIFFNCNRFCLLESIEFYIHAHFQFSRNLEDHTIRVSSSTFLSLLAGNILLISLGGTIKSIFN